MNKAYIANLRVETEAANLRHKEAKSKSQKTDKRILCDKPLTEQITELMATLPSAQRDRAWSMDELVARLQGRYSARPHPMNVGQALRALGWITNRDWTREGGGRRYWYDKFRQPSF
jgi:hypothetical protein